MSWFYGISGTFEKPLNIKHEKDPLFSFESEDFKIFAGGLKDNLYFRKKDEESGWIVSGIGIKRKESGYCLMTAGDWDKCFRKESFSDLNGHFIAASWNKKGVRFFNDIFGMRDIYLFNEKDSVLFATRQDLFSCFSKKFEININELGARWLLSFPLSSESLLKNVLRMGPGGRISVAGSRIFKSNQEPEFNYEPDLSASEFIEDLREITTFPLRQGRDVSMGLSGGLDSRVLLEMFLKTAQGNWHTHTFGPPDHPDVIAARRIASDIKLDYLNLYEPVPASDKCLNLLSDAAGQLEISSPASDVLMYPHQQLLYNKGWISIDGGAGEIHRRELFNRILYSAKNSILKKDTNNLFNIFSVKRAAIFNQDALNSMKAEAKGQVSRLFDIMPGIDSAGGLENWLDLLYLRFKFPNITGLSQSYLDSLSVVYMPYIQYHLLKQSFRLALHEKKNGKMFRDVLSSSSYSLDSYGLVKNSIYYPYRTGSFVKRLVLKFKTAAGMYYKDKTVYHFFKNLREYIFDIISSEAFNSFDYYDHKRIKDMVNDYYTGKTTSADELNWWLTFDIWRSRFFNK